jgi:excisionase family DNA binding protein
MMKSEESKRQIDDRLLLRADEVARLLSVCRRSVWAWASGGRMPQPVKIGRASRWRRTELEAWVEKGCPSCRDLSQKPRWR